MYIEGQNRNMVKEVDEKEVENEEFDPLEQAEEIKEEAPKDVRGAIRSAIREVEGESESESVEKEEKENEGEDKKVQGRSDTKEPGDRLVRGVRDSKIPKSKEDDEKEEVKIDPPGFWKTKGKITWDKLSSEDKQIIAAREKEVSDGFAQYSPKLKAYDELERVIAPRRQYIQAFGVNEAQTIDRLFQWMENISHPDPVHKLNSFKELARSFGVNVNQLVSRPKATNDTTPEIEQPEQPNNDEPPEWFSQFTSNVNSEIGGLKQVIATQKQATAQAFVDTWATAKDTNGNVLRPHFDKVRGLMAQLSTPHPQTGEAIVPLKDGRIDLDGAYDQAIKLHPEIAAQIQQEATEKASKEVQDKARKDAKDRADRLAKAKKAGAGLKPAAPAMGASVNRPNNLNGRGKTVSARDSIRAALEELKQ